MKSYWGFFGGRVCSKEFVPFGAHKGTVHEHMPWTERKTKGERQRELHISEGVGQALRLEIRKIKLLENIWPLHVWQIRQPLST